MFRFILAAFFLLVQVVATAQDFRFEDLKYPLPIQKLKLKSGTEIAYIDEGKGSKTLLFIHGLGSYSPIWKRNMEDLSKDYRCIAVDLPGYGKSSKSDSIIHMTFYAHTLWEFLQKLKINKPILAGHSMGGQIALMMALQNPQKVAQLILIAPAGIETFTPQQGEMLKTFTTPQAIQQSTEAKIEANWALNFYRPDTTAIAPFIADRIAMRQAPDFFAYCQTVARCVAGMVNEPVAQRLSEIKTPTLLIFGENDALIPNKYLNPTLSTTQIAQTGKEKIINSTLKLIPEAGHLVNFEKAAEVNIMIRNFLK
jgi:pimeloyl-ACP methyl ester carboxylesterase